MNRVTRDEREALIFSALAYVQFDEESGRALVTDESVAAFAREHRVSPRRARAAISAAARRIQAAHIRARQSEEGE